MIHYFKGRNLTHLGCTLGICIGLLAGLIAGGMISQSASLSAAIWVMLVTIVGLGLLGWIVGALVSPKTKSDAS